MSASRTKVDFQVLGTMIIRQHGKTLIPTAPKLRRVLTLLLIHVNRGVPTDVLAEELWQDSPPQSAQATLQTYIYQLRKLLGRSCETDDIIRTLPFGYMLSADEEQIDLYRFQELVSLGQEECTSNQLSRAAVHLREAVDMWQGPLLGGVHSGPVLQAQTARLDEMRINALRLRIGAELGIGRHHELVSELKSLVVSYPLHEWCYGLLMEALHRCLRRGEALKVYRDYRRTLIDELGLEPDASLQRLHQQILTEEP